MVKNKSFTLLALVAMFSACAFADVTISISGTFASNAATGTFSAPNAPWTLSFLLHNPPTVFGVMANSFDSTPLNTVFTLNGVSIPATGTEVFFANSAMNLFLDQTPVQFFVGTATPFFSGPFASPTLVPGSYPVSGVSVLYNQATISAPSTSSNLVIAQNGPPPTPAPSSVILVLLGLAGLGMMEIARRKQLTP